MELNQIKWKGIEVELESKKKLLKFGTDLSSRIFLLIFKCARQCIFQRFFGVGLGLNSMSAF